MSTIVTRSGKGVPLTATDHDNNVNNLNTDKVESLSDLSITATATEINLLDGVTATTAELNYVDGVTSNIQTQLGTKLPLAGGTMTGDVSLGDNVKAKFGASDDLQIYHDGSNSQIRDAGTGKLLIYANDGVNIEDQNGSGNMAVFNSGSDVSLYHNGSPKLATTSTGIDVTGQVSDSEGNVRSGRKNLIINGGFDVWQRGTSASYSANTGRGYIVDRWYAEGYPLNITITKSTLVYDGISHKSASLSSITGSWSFFQGIEGARIANHNKTMTFSFVASGSGDVQTQYWAGATRNFGSSITLTNTPTRYEITHTLEAAATGDDLYIGFSGSGGSMNITSVQLELGSVATDFEHRSYGEELALCQRYYAVTTGIQQTPDINSVFNLIFPVQMRVSPSMSVSIVSGGGTGAATAYGPLSAIYSPSGATNRQNIKWTADAEL